MQSSGQTLVDQAKADGRWNNAYKPQSGYVIPDELIAEIEASSSPLALTTFTKMPKQVKLKVVQRIEEAGSSDNIAKYVKSIVTILERGEIPNDND